MAGQKPYSGVSWWCDKSRQKTKPLEDCELRVRNKARGILELMTRKLVMREGKAVW